MKVVILAGGLGTRLSEETGVRPKPMVEIGGKPILWHIMKGYSHFGFNDFVICLGYKGYLIKEYFNHYFLHTSDVTIDMANGSMEVHSRRADPWRVTLVDTGDETMTGGRLKRVQRYIDGRFMMTYGDGLSDINIRALLAFHRASKRMATVTSVQPPGRFGQLRVKERGLVQDFDEKPTGDGMRVSGGFFVFEPAIFDHLKGDDTILERVPMKMLTRQKQLGAYQHKGFWHPMDTLRDKNLLESLWKSDKAPWKIWPS